MEPFINRTGWQRGRSRASGDLPRKLNFSDRCAGYEGTVVESSRFPLWPSLQFTREEIEHEMGNPARDRPAPRHGNYAVHCAPLSADRPKMDLSTQCARVGRRVSPERFAVP